MKKNTLLKSTLIIMIVSCISRIIGFVRDMLIANNFGAGMYTDAYNIAVTVPETIFMLIGLAISTSFLPVLSKIKAEKGIKKMYDFANNMINILFIISLLFFVVTSIFSKEIVMVLGTGFDAETTILATRLTRITLINLLFMSINACFTSLLQVNEDFIIPSVLGLFFNLPMILYLLFFRSYDIIGLTIANVIGNFFRVIIQIPSLVSHGYKYKFFVNLKDEGIRAILILIIPVIIAAGANSLNMVVDKRIASSLEIGSISALGYAEKLIFFINSIITTSISSVAYPMMANAINEKRIHEFIELLKKSIIYLALVLIPITVGVIIFRKDIVSIIYERGKFTEYAVNLTTSALLGYTFGIFFTGMRDILNSTLFSMGKTKITTLNGIIGVIINICLSIILSKTIGISGVALASSIAMFITSILLFRNITNLEHNFNYKKLFIKIFKIIANSILMGLIIILFIKFVEGKIPQIIIIILGTAIGIIAYFSLCNLFNIKEVQEMKELALSKVAKKK
ncbi:murein biosynthesis integral membrane protein MurJ [Clostridium taeniosporum]|uniref:Probable lipid II flippase MurJ n=1 Tax=Clostridium taeniosporum TaxID=394958 RepID=A0A1D7XKU3_9CLOT|nr:murein biosynthesis integral membrane protein MurJ [Clostridium taeniosporum]AOR23958.1 murein biosynthesis integral membrane protein MurJ [Clostridium taeniosporum]